MKKMIEVNDTLEERCQNCLLELSVAIKSILSERENMTFSYAYNYVKDIGHVYEIINTAVPICKYEIKDLWYLHDIKFREAYKKSGLKSNYYINCHYQTSAIYFYIEQWIEEHLKELEEKCLPEKGGVFDEYI